MDKLLFWKKFVRFSLVGLSLLVLFAAGQQGLFVNSQEALVRADDIDVEYLGSGPLNPIGDSISVEYIGSQPLDQGTPSQPAQVPTVSSGPYIISSGAKCIGRESCWVNVWSDGRDDHECYGEIVGQCGVEAPSQPAPAPAPQPAPAVPAPAPRQPQNNCGSLSQGESTCRDGRLVFCKVEGNGDSNVVDTGSTCGTPAAQPQRTSFVNNCQGRANGESTCLDGQIKVCRCFSDGCSLENTGSTCGGQGAPAAPAPAQPAPQPQQPSVSCPSGTTLVNNTCRPNLVCPSGTTLVMTSTGLACLPINIPASGGNNNNNTNNNSNSNVNTITVNNPQPAVQPVVRFATNECPDGFTRRVDGNIITCIAPAPQVVTVAGASTTKELPKTGLPALVWAAASFVPLGIRMKRFGKGITPNYSDPNFIWEERQFRSGIDKI